MARRGETLVEQPCCRWFVASYLDSRAADDYNIVTSQKRCRQCPFLDCCIKKQTLDVRTHMHCLLADLMNEFTISS